MNPFANMTPAMIEAHNARVAQRRAEYAKGNPFSVALYCDDCNTKRSEWRDGAGIDNTGNSRPRCNCNCGGQWVSHWAHERPRKAIPAVASVNPPVDRESKLHDQILAFCAGRWPRWLCLHARMDKRSTIAVGAQDITCFLPGGNVLCLELKAGKSKLTPEQQAWAKEMEMLGHCVYTVWSFADFESILRDKNLI